MLDASCHAGRIREVISLISLHHSHAHQSIKIRVFSGAFRYPSPPRVTGNVKHRRECPSDTGGRCLDSGHSCTLLHDGRVEGRCLTEWNREDCPESVDYVTAHDDRNAETASFHGCFLHCIDFFGINAVEYGTDSSGCNIFNGIVASGKLIHLTNFFFNGHFCHQFIHLPVYLIAGR